jgi:hypothetical protein
MSQRLILRQQNNLRTRIHYAIAGVTTGVFIASGLFLANHFGDTRDSVASINNNFTTNVMPLFPLDGIDETASIKGLPQLSISNKNDSVCFTLFATNTTVIDGAEIKIYEDNDLKMQPKIFKVKDKLNHKSYSITVLKKELADRIIVETRANIVNAKRTEQNTNNTDYKWLALFNYNSANNTAVAIPTAVKAENVQDKTATITWISVSNAIKYIVRSRPVGTKEWKSGIVTAPGNKRFLVNLNPKSEYEVQVRSIIYQGKVDTSSFSSSVYFKTSDEMVRMKPIELTSEQDALVNKKIK